MRRPYVHLASVLLIALVGCTTTNSADADLTVDATPIDGPPAVGPITVTFHDRTTRLPLAGVTIIVHDATGAVVTSGATAGDGTYTYATFTEGGMITAVEPTVLTTVMQLKPGQNVFITPGPLPTDRGTITAQWVAFPGASNYTVDTGCAATTPAAALTSAAVAVRNNCLLAGTTLRLVAYALDAAGQRIAYSVTDVPFPAASPIMMGPWKTDYATALVRPSNFPDSSGGTPTVLAQLGVFASAVPTASYSASSAPMTAAVVTPLRFARGGSDYARVAVLQSIAGALTSVETRRPLPAMVDYDEPIDLATAFLPRVTDLTISADAARRVFTPVLTAPLASADVLLVIWQYMQPAAATYSWLIVTQFAPTVQLPALPASLAAYVPVAGSTTVQRAVILMDYSNLTYTDHINGTRASILSGAERPPPTAPATFRQSLKLFTP
jgi:hypothetical protein